VFRGAIAALYATLGFQGDSCTIRPHVPVVIEAGGRSLDECLVAFLNELLFTLDTRGLLLPVECTVDITPRRDWITVHATGLGDRYSMKRYGPFREVKAATLHGLVLAPGPGGFRARIVFDV